MGFNSTAAEPAKVEPRTAHRRPAHLFVVPWNVTDIGGINQVILNLFRHFEAGNAYVPKILVNSWEHARPSTASLHGRPVSRMRLRPPTMSGSPWIALAKWIVFLIPELVRLAQFLRKSDVAIVNVHYPSLAALQFVLVRFLLPRRPKVVLSFHGLDLDHASRTLGLERRLWRVLLRNADAVVSCSEALKESIAVLDPGMRDRITTIHNGVDIGHLMIACNTAARIDARLQGRRFILSVASYEAKKGLDVLLRAFKLVRDDHGVDVMLALIGPDHGMGGDLRSLAAEIGVSDSVVLVGAVPHANLHAYYDAATVFCLASRAEPFGIVVLEAGAFRCPVVATSVGGIPEILEHGVNGCLVPPDDPVALAAQLAKLLCDRNLREGLSGELFEHVRVNFPWTRAHDSYMNLCHGP